MDTCTAIAMYAQETGLLIRGLLMIVAIGMVFAWKQGRKLRRTSLALQDSRRMAAGAQQRVRELEDTGAKFEAELRRVDRIRAKAEEGCQAKDEELQLVRSHFAALTAHVEA